MDIFQLILEASLVVKLVMFFLLLMSIYAWILILAKVVTVRKTLKQCLNFHKKFSVAENLFDFYQSLKRKEYKSLDAIEKIFLVGFAEYIEQSKIKPVRHAISIDLINRTMQQKFNEEMNDLEDRSPMLATIGSSAPYIGLFGTVWGIMTSFQALGHVKHATLSLVAPGITEALVATAMGLFVAIPAVIGYNRFITHSERISAHLEGFIDEFMRLIEKQFLNNKDPK